ncbi:respiratory nitrate reductase subunit gamma [Fibrobacterota bacterium]
MEPFLEFAEGPLFKFCLAVMVLGLMRTAFLGVASVLHSIRDTDSKKVSGNLIKQVLGIPLALEQPAIAPVFFRICSIIFHTGLILVAFFLLDHILLWREGLGISWPALNSLFADVLTLVCFFLGIVLLYHRLFNPDIRMQSSLWDYLFLVFMMTSILFGFVASQSGNPFTYEGAMLTHVLCGDIILFLFPFAKPGCYFLYPLLRFSFSVAGFGPAGTAEMNLEKDAEGT